MVLNGCFSASVSSSWQLCPLSPSGQACTGSASTPVVLSHSVPDLDGNGTRSAAERSACLALTPANLPGGGTPARQDRDHRGGDPAARRRHTRQLRCACSAQPLPTRQLAQCAGRHDRGTTQGVVRGAACQWPARAQPASSQHLLGRQPGRLDTKPGYPASAGAAGVFEPGLRRTLPPDRRWRANPWHRVRGRRLQR